MVRRRPLFLSLEGNIGAGKSTFLRKIEGYLLRNPDETRGRITLLREPVDKWNTIRDKETDQSLLEKYYEDAERYSFPFQMTSIITRIADIRRVLSLPPDEIPDIIIMERSPYSDKHVFMELLQYYNLIDDIERQVYELYYKGEMERIFGEGGEIGLDGIIYLDIPVDKCFLHIIQRGRDGENNIPISYLDHCNRFHVKMLEGLVPIVPIIPIVPIKKITPEELYDVEAFESPLSPKVCKEDILIKEVLDFIGSLSSTSPPPPN